MYRLTITQRMEIIKISATARYCALTGDYGLHNRSTPQAIG